MINYLSAFLNYTICAIFSTFAPLVTFINWNSRTYSQFSILGIGKVIYIGKLRTTGFFSLEITRFSRTFTAKRWVIRNDNAIRRFWLVDILHLPTKDFIFIDMYNKGPFIYYISISLGSLDPSHNHKLPALGKHD